MQGTLYIISAPSGTGKSSLLRALLKTPGFLDTKVSISHTTRAIRPGEIHGKEYFFIPLAEFQLMIAADAFIEYAVVFNNYYGTTYNSIRQMLDAGINVFLDIDWQGAQQVRAKIPDTRSIFLIPPSKEELVRRLRRRKQDSEESIALRTVKSIVEITHFTEYDYLIINDNFNDALIDLKTIFKVERLRLKQQKIRHYTLISKLLLTELKI